MKTKLKSQKGAITLIVLIGMVFLLSILMSVYIKKANEAQSSAETTKQIAEQYNNIGEVEDIYNSYFADSEIIPIYTREQLEKIASGEQVTIDGKIYIFSSDAYYTLNKDIDLGGHYDETTKTWIADDEWTPLPDSFTGVLDGLGHTITGLYIDDESGNQGLFGTLKGTVKNLRIINGYINGQSNIGAIAGTNEGTIENCYDKGIILSLTSDNGKVQVDGIWYETVENYVNGQPIVINFTIDDVEYNTAQGLNWEIWCSNEEYNTLGVDYFTKNDELDSVLDTSANKLLDSTGVTVNYSDLIKEGEAYKWEQQEITVENENISNE